MSMKTIMVCDDDQGIVDVLEILLDAEGFNVITEINSTNLLKKIEVHKPDLLLLDLWMPLLSGDQVLKTIRNTESIKKLPVIVLSASVDGSDIAEDAGANDFVAKPFNLDDIINKIKVFLY
ncbi:histidine kinase [Chryseobacterium formosense]|uniref:Histidine kinase n=2 Tax=Chryseobacterium formosense TaxID=236814 RepID=A0A085Z7W2_9FLAO|nr:histidine kinase [Chryseobacterium formosense]